VGREEVIGMLAAVESWVKRDHDAEWAEWVGRCDTIANRVTKIPGVTASVRREPGGRGNRSPRVSIQWDSKKLGITGAEVTEILDTTEPRIVLGGGGAGRDGETQGGADTGISITAFQMAPGDDKIVAERVHQILSAKHTLKPVAAPKPPAGNVSGHWKVDVQFAASKSIHTFDLVQDGARVKGTYQGDFRARELTGTIDGDTVAFATRLAESRGENLGFRFAGRLNGDSRSGTIDMGEYLEASFTARRA